MSERFPHQVNVSLTLYGASKQDLKRALDEAYDQLSQGIPESNTELSGNAAAFSYTTNQGHTD